MRQITPTDIKNPAQLGLDLSDWKATVKGVGIELLFTAVRALIDAFKNKDLFVRPRLKKVEAAVIATVEINQNQQGQIDAQALEIKQLRAEIEKLK